MHCQLEIKHLSAAFMCTEVEVQLRLGGNYCSVKCPPRKDVVGLGLILVFERMKLRCRGAKTIVTRTKLRRPGYGVFEKMKRCRGAKTIVTRTKMRRLGYGVFEKMKYCRGA
jgi:hypothetical protein